MRILDLRPPRRGNAIEYVRGSIPTQIAGSNTPMMSKRFTTRRPAGRGPPRRLPPGQRPRTAIVIAAAGKRRFRFCTVEHHRSFSVSPRCAGLAKMSPSRRTECVGASTRPKMLGEQQALAGCGVRPPRGRRNPTMPTGPPRNLTPPTLMLQHLEPTCSDLPAFHHDLVDVRDVATVFASAMERGQTG